jgi:hypothetical protein
MNSAFRRHPLSRKKTKQQPDLFLFSRFSAGRQPRTTAPGSTKQPEKPNS